MKQLQPTSLENLYMSTKIASARSAMVLNGNGGMDMYEWRTDWPTPTPDANDVLIRVAACGLNNTDVNTRSGWYSKRVSKGA